MGRPRKASASLAVDNTDVVAPQGKKRGRPSTSRPSSAASGDLNGEATKKRKTDVEDSPLVLTFRHTRGSGHVLTVGQGDTGQLGLGEDVMEKTRPQVVSGIESAVDVAAGGMHTAVLDSNGKVWTFGCNDEGSLGRHIEEEEDSFLPGEVTLPSKAVMICCGDSHTAALTQEGEVWAWGTFRDSSGPIGLMEEGQLQKTPLKVMPGVQTKKPRRSAFNKTSMTQVVKICSGSDHLVMLTRAGEIYTMGNAEQGQLGRIMEKFCHRGGRRGIDTFLKPDRIHVKSKYGGFAEVWAGSYNTVAVAKSGEVLVCGLNNYNQLGVSEGLTFYMPVVSRDLSSHSWGSIAIGQHHAIGQEKDGRVLALGRSEYGRLGLGDGTGDASKATEVTGVNGCTEVACGTAVSYAVTGDGKLYSWGMGTNGQLGTGEEDDVWQPYHVASKQVKDRIVIAVSSGGQHTVMIAKDKVEGEEEVNGAVNDKTIQEEPAVNGTAAEKMDEN